MGTVFAVFRGMLLKANVNKTFCVDCANIFIVNFIESYTLFAF